MQGIHLRKYGVEAKIPFVLYEIDGVDLRIDAADGGSDCSIMKDEGAEVTCENDFVDEGKGYSITLSATEMTAARIVIYVVDSATKVWLDDALVIETYGNASAQHAFDLDIAMQGVNIVSENNIDFGAAKKTSLNAATPNLSAITGDKASYKATGFSTHNAAAVKTAIEAGGSTLALIKAVTDALPDAGALTTIGTDTARLTDVRAAVLTDWINGGRLDLLLDAVKIITDLQRSVSGTVVVNTPDTIFDLTAVTGTLSTNNDAYNNMVITFFDISGNIYETRKVSTFVGANGRVTIDKALTFPVDDGVDTFILWNKYSPTAAAGGGATAQEVHEYDVSEITTKGQAGYEIQQRGGKNSIYS